MVVIGCFELLAQCYDRPSAFSKSKMLRTFGHRFAYNLILLHSPVMQNARPNLYA